nr:MAG TPA: hypothetical protein [Caudoviricetes sp.]
MAEPLSRLAEKCKSCPKSEKCDHKRMELCALMDLPPQNLASATQGILIDNMSPILREEITKIRRKIRIRSLCKTCKQYNYICRRRY